MNSLKKNLIEKVYIVVAIVCACLAIICGVESVHEYTIRSSTVGEELEATSREVDQNGVVSYTFDQVEWVTGYRTLLFYSNHQNISVYINDSQEPYFSRLKANSVFGHTTGSAWNIVTIPANTYRVMIVFDPVYSNVANTEVIFFKGNGNQMMLQLFRGGIFNCIASLLILVVGFCLVIYWCITRRFTKDLKNLLYVGCFAMILGLWSVSETDIVQMLVQNRVSGTFIGFTCVGLLGPSAVLFARYFFKTKEKYAYKVIVAICLVILVSAIALQGLNIVDMKQIAPLIQAGIPISFVYWIYGIVVCAFRRNEKRRVIVNLIGVGCLAISVLVDFVAYYTSRSSANRSGKYGFLIYIIIIGADTAYQSAQHVGEMRQLELYREMATKDMLTGCFNRNAYNNDVDELDNYENITIVTFDLNNLKLCNDSMGHAKGDEYLMNMAKLMRQYFNKYGRLYRVGGDEFVALLCDIKKDVLDSLLVKLGNESISNYENEVVSGMGIASGCAVFDEKLDASLKDTLARADVEMYKNKRELKGMVASE